MLSTLLSQTATVLSRLFVFASFVPALVFAFVNGALLYLWHPGFRTWVSPQLHGAELAFSSTATLVGIAVCAYILFALNNSLRVVLENGLFLIKPIRDCMIVLEQGRLAVLTNGYITARNERRAFEKFREKDDRLKIALNQGAAAAGNTYDWENSDAAKAVANLKYLTERNGEINASLGDAAITRLALEMRKNNPSIKESNSTPPPGASSMLVEDHRRLLIVFDQALNRWKSIEADLYNQLQLDFGVQTPKPTRLGNVAEALNGYAISRYHLNLPLLWSRFVDALRKDKDAFSALDETKTQLDFLVACTWLSGLSWLAWMALLMCDGYSIPAFLAVSIVGPVVTYGFYRFAVESYKVFAEAVRAAIDQHRFKILEAIGIPVPGGIRDERELWDALDLLVSGRGEYLDLSYSPRAKPS